MVASPVPDDSIVPAWPDTAGPVVFLLDAATRAEEKLLRDWIRDGRPSDADTAVDIVRVPANHLEDGTQLDPRLGVRLGAGDDPLLAPLRVAWLPAERDGKRAARLSDLLTFSNPRDPSPLEKLVYSRNAPDRWRIVAGEPAKCSELKAAWAAQIDRDDAAIDSLPRFVAKRATLALDRAERRAIGSRYKIPRAVREEVLERATFRTGVARLARGLGRGETSVMAEAADDLREIAAGHSPYVIDKASDLSRAMWTGAYDRNIDYDREEVARIADLGRRHALVFLPTHKTYLDTLILRQVMLECGMPPNHVAAGINLNFFPFGAILRRSGMFFIRRSFKDDEVYKFVLREYITYLLEKRFALEWYIEGGRSRSGKMLPPKMGLLNYVTDAYETGGLEDVYLVPVSIVYDQISDVGTYAAEQRGAEKKSESLGMAIRYINDLQRKYGSVAVRFGEPLSMRSRLGAPHALAGDSPDVVERRHLEVQKMALAVSNRINQVTPMTATSLVTLCLLGTGGRALTLDQICARLNDLAVYVERRNLPLTKGLDLRSPVTARATLELLMGHGVVTCFAEGADAVYAIRSEEELTAAYYRNTVIHFFVNSSITEVSLLAAAGAQGKEPSEVFWQWALRLRDTLKFEFFFSERDRFVDEIKAELALHDDNWEQILANGGTEEITALLYRFRPFFAPTILRPFLEAYMVVADELERRSPTESIDLDAFVDGCLKTARQYALQRRIQHEESISKVLFEGAVKLARNRDLWAAGSDGLADRRRRDAATVRTAVSRIDAINALVTLRNSGLLD